MADDDGKQQQRWGRQTGDPLGRRAPDEVVVEDAFALGGREPTVPVRDGGRVVHLDRGWETRRESLAAARETPEQALAREAAHPTPPTAAQAQDRRDIQASAVRQAQIEHAKAQKTLDRATAKLAAAEREANGDAG